jgi:proteasome accessory factor C
MREAAEARLGRLLAVVPWIAAHDGPAVAEVCERFGVSERDLIADLELLFLCGVYPFTPDVLIDVHFEDGRVWVSMADYFRRPLRLDPREALALVAAGRALLAMPDSDPDGLLAGALAKLDRALGLDSETGLDMDLAAVDAAVLGRLRRAVDARRKVRIRYYSFGADRRRVRVVRPWRVLNSAGEWYLQAWCEAAGGPRHFRLDRIEQLEDLDESFEDPLPPPADPARGVVFHPSSADPRWVLDLEPPAHWIADQYPMESVESGAGGVLRVALRAAPGAWMERLLLRAGPHARVVEGDPIVGRAAAERLLARYRADP